MSNALACLINLYQMRRKSAGRIESIRWAFSLLWSNHKTSHRRARFERRAEVERAGRQRL